MRLDAIRTMKCALAGTATTKFTDVLEAVFGIDEEEVPDFEEEEDEPDTIPEEGLTTKETAESAESTAPEASTSSGTGVNVKPLLFLQVVPNARQASLLKPVFVR